MTRRYRRLVANEGVFRYVSLRPGVRERASTGSLERIDAFADVRDDSTLLRDVEAARQRGAPRAEVVALAREFKKTPGYVRSLDDLAKRGFAPRPLLSWIATSRREPIESLDIASAFQTLYGTSLATFLQSPERRVVSLVVAESMFANAIAPEHHDEERTGAADLVSVLKSLHLLRLSADGALPSGVALGRVLARWLALLPVAAPRVRREAPQPTPTPSPTDPRDDLRKRLASLEAAHRELSRVAVDEGALSSPPEPAPPTIDREAPSVVSRAAAAVAGNVRGDDPNATLSRPEVVLNEAATKRLTAATRALVAEVGIPEGRIQPLRATALFEDEISVTSSVLASDEAFDRRIVLGGISLDIRALRASLGLDTKAPSPSPVLMSGCQLTSGIADLLMVKQTLKAYEVSDFAHVENVLAGESREREHRRLSVREEEIVEEQERTIEKERDLQSTERSELQVEADRTVRSELALDAGLSISGSYGPAISFTASLDSSFSVTVEESQHKATTYSREVTERASERIRERVREERRRRVLEEIEETNRHRVENASGTNGHVRGIYRWLNKIYDAQVFNYGQRMMCELVAPEPAAFFLYAFVENPPQDLDLVKPEPPTYAGQPLKPSHLTRTNYQSYLAKYQVTNVKPPPSQFLVVSHFDRQDGNETGNLGRATKLTIPDGYEAYAALVTTDWVYETDRPRRYRVIVGGEMLDRTDIAGASYRTFSRQFRSEMTVSAKLMAARAFVLGVDVFCRLTADGLAVWQQAAYDAIQQAYVEQRADYDEAIAAKAIQKGPVQILGRNPLENRRLERDELKKLFIMAMTGTTEIARDAYEAGGEPILDIARACENGPWIRFFENAFEWNNLLYVFYPYFWGRKPRWISALHLVDPDPDFAAFLKSGAARVQVPVRPGFERAVAHFFQTGEIWEGNDPPLVDDELYVPIVDEIAENLGRLDGGIVYPEGALPWEVRVPTSLVLLQDIDEIPGIVDVLTGQPIDLLNRDA